MFVVVTDILDDLVNHKLLVVEEVFQPMRVMANRVLMRGDHLARVPPR